MTHQLEHNTNQIIIETCPLTKKKKKKYNTFTVEAKIRILFSLHDALSLYLINKLLPPAYSLDVFCYIYIIHPLYLYIDLL